MKNLRPLAIFLYKTTRANKSMWFSGQKQQKKKKIKPKPGYLRGAIKLIIISEEKKKEKINIMKKER